MGREKGETWSRRVYIQAVMQEVDFSETSFVYLAGNRRRQAWVQISLEAERTIHAFGEEGKKGTKETKLAPTIRPRARGGESESEQWKFLLSSVHSSSTTRRKASADVAITTAARLQT